MSDKKSIEKTDNKLKSELEILKKENREIKKVIAGLNKQDKYLIGVIRQLSGELIQLQHEVDGLRYGRRK